MYHIFLLSIDQFVQSVTYVQNTQRNEQKVAGTKRALKICEQNMTNILNLSKYFMVYVYVANITGKKEECTTIIGTRCVTIPSKTLQ